jgi:predicted dehydrogenase
MSPSAAALAKRVLRAGRRRMRQLLTTSTPVRAEPLRLERTLRVAVIGSGKAAEYHLHALRLIEGVSIACLANRGSDASRLVQQYRIPHYYPSVERLIASPDLFDAVIVAVIPEATPQVVRAVMALAKSALIEKPLALSVDEAMAVRDAASSDGRAVYAVGYNRRWYSSVTAVRDVVRVLGPLYAMTVDAPEDALKVLAKSGARGLDQRLVTNTSHALDLMTHFAGPAVEVVTLPRAKRLAEARVDYQAMLAFESGVTASFTSHWRSPGDWWMVLYGHDYRIDLDLRGNRAVVDHAGRRVVIEPSAHDLVAKPGVLRQNHAFLQAVARAGPVAPPLCSLSEALESLSLAARLMSR